LPPHFIPPVPESPLPQEHRYKLRMRCSECLTDSYPVAMFGVRRISAVEVTQRVTEFAYRLELPCHSCGGLSSRLISFFPDRTKDERNVSYSS
jgi:hypothetical protein